MTRIYTSNANVGIKVHRFICDRDQHEYTSPPHFFYMVEPGMPYAQYRRGNERRICDICMWKDPAFIKAHPHVADGEVFNNLGEMPRFYEP